MFGGLPTTAQFVRMSEWQRTAYHCSVHKCENRAVGAKADRPHLTAIKVELWGLTQHPRRVTEVAPKIVYRVKYFRGEEKVTIVNYDSTSS